MADKKNLGFNLQEIAKTFQLKLKKDCEALKEWIANKAEFNDFEQKILNDTLAFIQSYNEQMNEEELKIRMIAPIFYVAKVDEEDKLMVFYERALGGNVEGHELAVITDCMVATPVFNAPDVPYFLLQEFKKKKGDKKDPEAQMLVAMLIAQVLNANEKPIYGGYLIGTSWKFATLTGKNYCVSPLFEATKKDDLYQIAAIIRYLRNLAE